MQYRKGRHDRGLPLGCESLIAPRSMRLSSQANKQTMEVTRHE